MAHPVRLIRQTAQSWNMGKPDMNAKSALLSALAVLLAASSSAFASDIGSPTPASVFAPAPIINWSGFYIGGNIGGAFARGSVSDSLFQLGDTMSQAGFLGGAQAGFNYQFGSFVVGVEWDFDGTSLNATGPTLVTMIGTSWQGSANTDWVSTVAARVGMTTGALFVYGKVGGGWAEDSARATNLTTGGSLSASNTTDGWLGGIGIEWAFAPNWSTKLEFYYIGLQSWTLSGPTFAADSFTVVRNIEMLKAGINYRFNWGY
jgi:opacity protein-like surface antigen